MYLLSPKGLSILNLLNTSSTIVSIIYFRVHLFIVLSRARCSFLPKVFRAIFHPDISRILIGSFEIIFI